MKFSFSIYSPGGNITALVETRELLGFPKIAKKIMQSNPAIEQVGFIMPARKEMADFHLEMMGGEFCANAARCAALQYFFVSGKNTPVFTVSGFDVPLTADIQNNTVSLQIPGEFIRSIEKLEDGWLVNLFGIRFFVTENLIQK